MAETNTMIIWGSIIAIILIVIFLGFGPSLLQNNQFLRRFANYLTNLVTKRAQIAALQQQISNLQQQQNTAEAQLKEFRRKSNTQVMERDSEISKLKQRLTTEKATAELGKAQVSNLQKTLKTTTKDFNTKLQQKKQELEEASKTFATNLSATTNEYYRDLETKNKTITSNQQIIANLQQQVQNEKNQVQKIQQELTDYQQQTQNEIASKTYEIHELENEITLLKQQLRNNEISDKQSTINELTAEIAALKAELEAKTEQTNKQILELETNIEQNEQIINKHLETISTLQQEKSETIENITSNQLDQFNKEWTEKLEKLTEELNMMHEKHQFLVKDYQNWTQNTTFGQFVAKIADILEISFPFTEDETADPESFAFMQSQIEDKLRECTNKGYIDDIYNVPEDEDEYYENEEPEEQKSTEELTEEQLNDPQYRAMQQESLDTELFAEPRLEPKDSATIDNAEFQKMQQQLENQSFVIDDLQTQLKKAQDEQQKQMVQTEDYIQNLRQNWLNSLELDDIPADMQQKIINWVTPQIRDQITDEFQQNQTYILASEFEDAQANFDKALDESNKMIINQQNEMQELRKSLESTSQNLEKCNIELDEINNKNQDLSKQINDLRDQLSDEQIISKSVTDEQHKTIEGLRIKNNDLIEENQRINDQRETDKIQYTTKNQNLQHMLNEKTEQVDHLVTKIKAMKQENTLLSKIASHGTEDIDEFESDQEENENDETDQEDEDEEDVDLVIKKDDRNQRSLIKSQEQRIVNLYNDLKEAKQTKQMCEDRLQNLSELIVNQPFMQFVTGQKGLKSFVIVEQDDKTFIKKEQKK